MKKKEYKETTFIPQELKIVCVFCNAPWTAAMEVESWIISDGCDTCGHGSETEYVVEIRCNNCSRVVYKKEGTKRG